MGNVVKGIFWTVVGFGVLAYYGSQIWRANQERANATAVTSHKPAAPAPPPRTFISTTPEELLSAFEENEIAAKRRFSGQDVKISGTVDSVNTDFSGRAYVKFAERAGLRSVAAKFINGQEPILATLHKGDFVTAKCDSVVLNLIDPEGRDCFITH